MIKVNGWLNIDKPLGISSAKIVAKIKRILGKNNKVGHAGTLDPAASGVLPIAVGEATKLTNYMIDQHKIYSFVIQFGQATDTGDTEGKVIASSDVIPSEQQCAKIVTEFIGNITQIPHKFSALKVNGKRAYDFARNGQDFELAARNITIYDLKLLNFDAKKSQAEYICKCSKGTYIRSLAEDIAKSLQSLGFVVELRRLNVGAFNISQAINAEIFEKNEAEAELLANILAVDLVLDDILGLEIDDIIAKKIRFGQMVNFANISDQDLIYLTHNGNLIAIGAIKSGYFDSMRVFNL